LRAQQEKKVIKRVQNKDQLLGQIEVNKLKAKEAKWQNLQEEVRMIKEVVLDVNDTVAKVRDTVVQDLVTTNTLKNARVIKRIGKK